MEVIEHAVRYLSRLGAIIVLIMSIANALFIARLTQDNLMGLTLLAIAIILGTVVLIQAIVAALKKATSIRLYPDKLVLNDRIINPGELKIVMTRGYFKPVVGLLPHGKRIVPMDMAFRFTADEDQAFADLRQWAERNHVPMADKWFCTWV